MTRPILAEWLARLERLHPNDIELGLDRIRSVANALAIGVVAPRTVVVAGTNGKGSTVAMLAAAADSLGLHYGCYTSPHLLCFNERITIDSTAVDDASLIAAFERIDAARGDVALTYFEFTTLAAFICIAEAKVDVAFLEVGLGGRLDAVNIIDADVAIVTSIAIDHEAWLGNSRDLIAIEKAGIARAGKPLLVGDIDPPSSLLEAAARHGAQAYCLGRDFSIDMDTNSRATISLIDHRHIAAAQPQNLSAESMLLALQALALLGFDVSSVDTDILAGTELPGRYYRRTVAAATVIFDVAHNPAAVARLVQRVQHDYPDNNIDIVFAVMADKDYSAMIANLSQLPVRCWWLPTLAVQRALKATDLAAAIGAYNCDSMLRQTDIESAFESLERDQVLLICGSFYTVAYGLERLQQWVDNGE